MVVISVIFTVSNNANDIVVLRKMLRPEPLGFRLALDPLGQ